MADQPTVPSYGSDEHRSQLADAVLKHILSTLQQPAPQAPAIPQQQGLSPLKAAAAALNPQFAPLLLQQANAPAQAQYQQQQQAFEQAMQGRREALSGGIALAGQGSKEDIARMQIEQKQRDAAIQEQLRQLGLMVTMRGQDIGAQKSQEANWQVVGPDPNGDLWQVNPKTGEKRSLGLKKPSPQDKQMESGLQGVQDTLDEMRGLYTTAIQQHGPGERNLQEGLQGVPIVRNIAGAFDPLAQQHEALRNKLVLQLNKPVSGQQRLLTSEINQLLKYVPAYGTDPKVAMPQFDSMQRMIDQMKTKYSGPSPAQASAPSGGQFSGKTLPRAKFNQLKPSEQSRWTNGGGSVGD